MDDYNWIEVDFTFENIKNNVKDGLSINLDEIASKDNSLNEEFDDLKDWAHNKLC